MKFGLAQPPLRDVAATVELFTLAEGAGFDTIWVADQTFYTDPYVLLTLAARETSRAELAIGLTNPSTRHPAITARSIASVANVAGPRVALALGAGNNQELLTPLGLLPERPVVAMREAMTIIKTLLAGERVAVEGEIFRAVGIELEMTPPPPIPILVGGRGEQTMRLAGRRADGVVLSLAGLPRAWDFVQEGAERSGRDPATLRRVAWGQCVVDATPEMLEKYRKDLGHVLGRAPEAGLRVMGIDPERSAALKEAYRAEGPVGAARHVTMEMVEHHMIVGDVEGCVAQLEALERTGIQDFALLVKNATFEERAAVVERFAREIIPRFRGA